MAVDDAPTTVTDAVALLRTLGYEQDLDLQGNELHCPQLATSYPASAMVVDHTYRFEGDSDPGDEAIVLGMHLPGTEVKAVLVSAFGPGADPETAAFLANLHHP